LLYVLSLFALHADYEAEIFRVQASAEEKKTDVEKITTLEAALDTYSQNSALTITQQGLQACYHNVVALRAV
jgi:hypothetical protein